MNSDLPTKNSTMPRSRILMNTCISTKRRNWSKKNSKSGTKKTMMKRIITNKMKTRRKSGTRYLTGILLWTLH